MATKYGYVSRDRAERQIDWGEIGKQVSDEIVKINEDRKERREDILQKSTDYAKMLVEMPMGSNTAFNEYLAQFTSQASKAALEDLNALKRGEISEQEYYNRRANLKSGTELMIAGANNFNKNYDLIQERIDKGVASLVEIKYREKMAELLEFGNRTPFINPDTREVNTARLAPRGVMETTVEDIASASDMFRISNFQLNKFNMDKAVNDIKKGIGIQDVTVTQEMIDQGLTTAAVGTRIKGAFNSALMSEEDAQKAKQDLVSSYMKDDAAVISILADYVPGFGVTLDPFEVDENTVLIARNGSYEISEAQRKAAEDYMIKRVDQALPQEVTPEKGLTAYQRESLQLQREAGRRAERGLDIQEQRIKQTKEEDEPVAYESGVSIFIDNEGNQVRSSSFVKDIDTDSFSDDKIIDTKENFDALFEMQNYKGATINPVKKSFGIQKFEVPVPTGAGKTGTREVEQELIKDAVEIFVPEYMDKPLAIPQSEIIGKNLHEVIKVIDKARREKRKVNEVEFETIFGKDIYSEFNAKRTGSMSDFN